MKTTVVIKVKINAHPFDILNQKILIFDKENEMIVLYINNFYKERNLQLRVWEIKNKPIKDSSPAFFSFSEDLELELHLEDFERDILNKKPAHFLKLALFNDKGKKIIVFTGQILYQ